jgi:hypothetical protein
MNTQLIPKEQLGICQFTSMEVLRGDWEKVYRVYALQRAERIGKRSAGRVRLTFRTMANETRMVKAVVTSVSDQYVFLAGGYTIPLQAILIVEF